MSTLGPSQLFKPNDGDRKKEETEGSGDEQSKNEGQRGREREGSRRRQLSSLLRFPAIGCCRCRRASASITGLETVLINPRANAAVPSILFYLHFAPGSTRWMPTLICLGILRRALSLSLLRIVSILIHDDEAIVENSITLQPRSKINHRFRRIIGIVDERFTYFRRGCNRRGDTTIVVISTTG